MKKIVLIGFITLFSLLSGFELNQLIDCPTAGILQKGEAEITTKLYKDNGLLIGTKVGLFPRFMFGVQYGGEKIVGNQEPVWHKRVEFNAKFRFFDESPKMPAIAAGFDSQGHGSYNSQYSKYEIKSKGFYLVGSKNYHFLGNIGFHFGGNYSLETKDKDDEFNFFLGMDKDIGEVINLLVEYDFALNSNEDLGNNSFSENLEVYAKGYLNAAIDIKFTDYLILKIALYDLLENRSDTKGGDRFLKLIYNMTF